MTQTRSWLSLVMHLHTGLGGRREGKGRERVRRGKAEGEGRGNGRERGWRENIMYEYRALFTLFCHT